MTTVSFPFEKVRGLTVIKTKIREGNFSRTVLGYFSGRKIRLLVYFLSFQLQRLKLKIRKVVYESTFNVLNM